MKSFWKPSAPVYPPCKRVESMPNLSHSVRTSKIWSWMECASQMILSGPEICNSQCKKRTSKEQADIFLPPICSRLTAPSGCAKHHKPKLAQNRPDRQSCGTKYLWGNNMNIEQPKASTSEVGFAWYCLPATLDRYKLLTQMLKASFWVILATFTTLNGISRPLHWLNGFSRPWWFVHISCIFM